MRTWDQNRQAINQLWPLMEFTDEEKRLWHDDLSVCDQEVLYDAIRNVKRNNESNYPQLKWIRDEYRGLERLKKFSTRPMPKAGEERQPVVIDSESDSRIGDELRIVCEMATPAQYQEIVDLIADKAAKLQIEMLTARRLIVYLQERLGMSLGGAA